MRMSGAMRRSCVAIALAALASAAAVRADDLGAPGGDLTSLFSANGTKIDDPAPLWSCKDRALQERLDHALTDLGLDGYTATRKLGVTLVDVTDVGKPRVAEVNGDTMMYAASLPKIAVLLTAFEQIKSGKLKLDAAVEGDLEAMIQKSSNTAATAMIHRVGKEDIARVLASPRYRLYDPAHNGGLWVGKDYGKAGLWRRDPLHDISHGATSMQVARFYYLLQTDNLVSPEYSAKMREILGRTALQHKFVAALRDLDPAVHVMRKSGSWGTFHCDSALVEHHGRSYIAVALTDHPDGATWLGWIVRAMDSIILQAQGTTGERLGG
jgi:beta-lactamase class A